MTSLYASSTPMQGAVPIPTEYGGVQFRSRLEARWAVFFDCLNITWQYEPEAYERTHITDDGEMCRWLPDFYLSELGTWVEVKGGQAAMNADWDRIVNMLDWGSPVPGINDSYGDQYRGVLLLGDIPRTDRLADQQVPTHPIVQSSKGLWVHGFTFSSGVVRGSRRSPVAWPCRPGLSDNYYDSTWGDASPCPPIGAMVATFPEMTATHATVRQAYAVARRHRFWDPR